MALAPASLVELYLAYLGRPPDAYGASGEPNPASANVTPDRFAAFSNSVEYAWLVDGQQHTAGVPEIVDQIYHRLFNRAAEPAGLTYWTTLVAQGLLSQQDLPIAILQAAKGAGPGNPDAVTLAIKLSASAAFFAFLDTPLERTNFAGMDSAQVAREFLQDYRPGIGIPENDWLVFQEAIGRAIAVGQAPGTSFTLTSNADAVGPLIPTILTNTGFGLSSNGPDLFQDDGSGSADRYTGDRLDGDFGIDTLRLASFNADTARAQIVNVERVEASFDRGGAVLDLSGVRDLQSVVLHGESVGASDGSPGWVVVRGLSSSADVEAGMAGGGPGLLLDYADRALPDNEVTLDLSGSHGAQGSTTWVSIPDIEHLVVEAAGGAASGETVLPTIDATQARTVTIDAHAPVVLGGFNAPAGLDLWIRSDGYVRSGAAALDLPGANLLLDGSGRLYAELRGVTSFVSRASGTAELYMHDADLIQVAQTGSGSIRLTVGAAREVWAHGGAGADAFALSELGPVATFTGGAGTDDFVVPEAQERSTLEDVVAAAPSITDFGRIAGEEGDRLRFAQPLHLTTNDTASAGVARIDASGMASFDPADATLLQRVEAVAAGIRAGGGITSNSHALFAWQGDTYVFKGASGPELGWGGTDLVRLAGVALDPAHFALVDGVLTGV